MPARATAAAGVLACMRCGTTLSAETSPHAVGVGQSAGHGVDLAGEAQAHASPPRDNDHLQFDQDMRQLKGMVAAARNSRPAGMRAPAFPSPQATPPPAHDHGPHPSIWAGFLVSSSLVALVGGLLLLSWSYFMEHDELRTVGVLVAVGGQLGLLRGLISQIEHLWQAHDHAFEMLDDLEVELHELRQASVTVGGAPASVTNQFYAHLAEGASPQLLLADLKGQLDMLATRMGRAR